MPDLKELFKQASEIAQQVPENMQEAAFNRAIDLLTGDTSRQAPAAPVSQAPTRKKKTSQKSRSEKTPEPANDLLKSIDSTQHPGITAASKILDRSLMILQIAYTDHGVDGLAPSEIAEILTDKFRVNTRSAAVSNALGEATNLVNRVPDGAGYRYKIMGPGEEYLAHMGETGTELPWTKKKTKRAKKRTKKKVEKNAKKTGAKGSKKTASQGRIGPKAAVTSLIESGYFSTARTGPEVQAYIKAKRGFNFGTDQLRVAMLRLVRDQKLNREENPDGRYEYKKSES